MTYTVGLGEGGNVSDAVNRNNPSIIDINDIIFNEQGIDTITQIANYTTVKNILQREGLEIQRDPTNLPINPYLKSIEKQFTRDQKRRYKKEQYQPMIEYVKISEGKGLSTYMIIVRNTPLLFDYAERDKKVKSHYCQVIFTGLHQPTKQISRESIKFISKFLKRKTFKLHSIDIAIDYLNDAPIDYKKKEEFKEQLKPLNNDSYICNGSSLYCNRVNDRQIDKILIYDKFKKQTTYQKQPLSQSLKAWKRLEVEVHPANKCSFMEYISSDNFIEALERINDIAHRVNVRGYNREYLRYQLNSFIDNRVINNNTSKEQFNRTESLKRFTLSDFRRYALI